MYRVMFVMARSAASSPATKPKLVFLQWDHSPYSRYAKYMMQHMRDHVRCLEQHFEVVVVRRGSLTGQLPRDMSSWPRRKPETARPPMRRCQRKMENAYDA